AYPAATGYGRLISEAYEAWDELWADLGESHLDARGFFCISREPGDEADVYREGMEAGGYPFERLEPAEAVARWPFLEPGSFDYDVYSPDGGALHCRRIAAGMARWLRANRAAGYENTQVPSVDLDEGRVVASEGGVCEADRVGVTAGAWVLKLFPEYG